MKRHAALAAARRTQTASLAEPTAFMCAPILSFEASTGDTRRTRGRRRRAKCFLDRYGSTRKGGLAPAARFRLFMGASCGPRGSLRDRSPAAFGGLAALA